MGQETICFIGGLGDIIDQIWTTDRYVRLSKLRERATVVLSCPNPGARDLFTWHPNAANFDLVEVPFHGVWSPDVWREYGVGEESPVGLRDPTDRVKLTCSPEDMPLLEELSKKPFLVFALSAGLDDRNIPSTIAERASTLTRASGLRVVTVGRTYDPILHESVKPNEDVRRSETHLLAWPGVLDAIDRLSVPGAMVAIAASRGVFCCHSAMCLASWHLRKPTFVLLPNHLYAGYKVNEDHNFGRDYPETFHGEFGDFSSAFFERWIDRVVNKMR